MANEAQSRPALSPRRFRDAKLLSLSDSKGREALALNTTINDVLFQDTADPCVNSMYFQIIGAISNIQRIAVSSSIRDLASLRERYGAGRWRKLKGVAKVRLANGRIRRVELHWYEAHGLGKKKLKIKRYLD